MAQVELGRSEIARYHLPKICMVCGAPATTEKWKTFSWHDRSLAPRVLVGVLTYILVSLTLTQRMRVPMQFCARHQNHYQRRNLVVSLTFVFFGILIVVAWLLAGASEKKGQAGDPGGLVCLGTLALAVFWVVFSALLQNSSIRPVEITGRSIILAKVHQGFIDALEEDRNQAALEEERRDEQPPPRRSRPTQDDDRYYDPKPTPRDPPPSDAYREER